MRVASWSFHCLCNLVFTWQVQAVLRGRWVAWGFSSRVKNGAGGISRLELSVWAVVRMPCTGGVGALSSVCRGRTVEARRAPHPQA